MLLYAFLGAVCVFAALAVARWRLGVFLFVLTAMLQEPVRKLVPGVPVYLVLTPLSVWLGMLIGAWRAGDLATVAFRQTFPRVWLLLVVYVLTLVIPAFLSLTYGPGSWKFTLLGVMTQGGMLGSLFMGYAFARRQGDVARLLQWYCLLSAVMMSGGLMERLGVGMASGVIGVGMFGTDWVTYRMGEGLHMMSGFFRSPDVMGWHAATLVMFGAVLSLRSDSWRRIGWGVVAGWGGVALMFCARRKMMSMIPVFAGVIFAVYAVQGHFGRLMRLLFVGGILVGVGSYLYLQAGADRDLERFYMTTIGEMPERVHAHGIASVVETVRQGGVFGYGLGMAVQGSHNISGDKPRIWQESGPSMLAAELGVPGLIVFILLLCGVLVEGYRALRNSSETPEYPLLVGIAGVVAANLSVGVVSSQIFGDPFIGCFFPFLAGIVLAGIRLARSDSAEENLGDVMAVDKDVSRTLV